MGYNLHQLNYRNSLDRETNAQFLFPFFPRPASTVSSASPEGQTKKVRGDETKLSLNPKAVTSSTIARWMKAILEASGVDTSIFNAHSVRGTSGDYD